MPEYVANSAVQGYKIVLTATCVSVSKNRPFAFQVSRRSCSWPCYFQCAHFFFPISPLRCGALNWISFSRLYRVGKNTNLVDSASPSAWTFLSHAENASSFPDARTQPGIYFTLICRVNRRGRRNSLYYTYSFRDIFGRPCGPTFGRSYLELRVASLRRPLPSFQDDGEGGGE